MAGGPDKVAEMIAQELLDQANDGLSTIPPLGPAAGISIRLEVEPPPPPIKPTQPARIPNVREEVVRVSDSRRDESEPPAAGEPPPAPPAPPNEPRKRASDPVLEILTDDDYEREGTPSRAPSDTTTTVRPPPDWDPSISIPPKDGN